MWVEWAGELSWWSCQFFAVHKLGRFCRTDSWKWRRTSWLYSLLIVRLVVHIYSVQYLCRKKKLKKQAIMSLTLLRTRFAFSWLMLPLGWWQFCLMIIAVHPYFIARDDNVYEDFILAYSSMSCEISFLFSFSWSRSSFGTNLTNTHVVHNCSVIIDWTNTWLIQISASISSIVTRRS